MTEGDLPASQKYISKVFEIIMIQIQEKLADYLTGFRKIHMK